MEIFLKTIPSIFIIFFYNIKNLSIKTIFCVTIGLFFIIFQELLFFLICYLKNLNKPFCFIWVGGTSQINSDSLWFRELLDLAFKKKPKFLFSRSFNIYFRIWGWLGVLEKGGLRPASLPETSTLFVFSEMWFDLFKKET